MAEIQAAIADNYNNVIAKKECRAQIRAILEGLQLLPSEEGYELYRAQKREAWHSNYAGEMANGTIPNESYNAFFFSMLWLEFAVLEEVY
jgi:hypothetical protein